MTNFGVLVAAGAVIAGAPCFAQTVGPCPAGVGSAAVSKPTWVMFDLGSAALRPEAKPVIADTVAKAKAQQAVDFCVIGQTDKLGDKALNEKLAAARARAVAAEMIRVGAPAEKVIIASNPEAFGNVNFGSMNASEKDRRVSILFK